jgi:hypothetical protein
MLDEIEKPPSGEGGLSRLSKAASLDNSEIKPPRPNTQIKFRDPPEAEFDGEIALALVGSGWRVTGCLLEHAGKCLTAGDFLGAERNRQRARAQFVETNDLWKQFQEARRAEADVISGSHRPPWRIRRRCRPGRQIKKKPKSATRRCIKISPPGGQFAAPQKKRFSEPGINDRRIKNQLDLSMRK